MRGVLVRQVDGGTEVIDTQPPAGVILVGGQGAVMRLVGAVGPQGPPGADGADGAPGADGADGIGLPAGGGAGEVPVKLSGADYDIGWGTVSGVGGGLADSYQGEWLMATAYAVGDVVTYQGETWYAANSSTGVTPAHPETFTDEFDSGAADGRTWELASATRTWEMDSFVSVQSGQLKNIAAAAQKWARIDLGSQYDFEIVGRGAVELVLNYFDVSNNVLWNGGTTVAKRVGGITTTVPIVGAAGSGGTDLRVQRRGDVYKFWRDSDLVGEINDATLDDTGGQKVGIKFDPLEAVNAVRARNGQTAWELLAGKGADGAAGPAGADGAAGPTGPAGADGVDGATGPAGADGVGLPPGGLTGQAAIKLSDADYDIGWGTVSGGGGGGSSYTRTTATHTTASLADDAREAATVTLAGAAAFRVYKVVADRACRVRIYTTTAKRDADLIRGIGTDPQGDHGLLLDVVFSSTLLSLELSPIVDAYLPGVAGTVPITVDNLSGATSPVQVTLTYVRSE